jgi:hypothetical protein
MLDILGILWPYLEGFNAMKSFCEEYTWNSREYVANKWHLRSSRL